MDMDAQKYACTMIDSPTDRLQHLMNSAARIISGTRKFENITPVLKTLHRLPIELGIMIKLSCLVFKVLHGLVPSYLAESIHRYQPARSLHSFSKDLLMAMKIRTQRYSARSFSYVAPQCPTTDDTSGFLLWVPSRLT